MQLRYILGPAWSGSPLPAMTARSACRVAVCALLGLAALTGMGCGRKEAIPKTKAVAPAAQPPKGEGLSLRRQIESLTGGATRLVWARDMGKVKDAFANGSKLMLMGLDTRLPSGERVLAADQGNYSRPLFAPDGESVVFSRRTAEGPDATARWRSSIFAVPWSGGPPQLLRSGYAVDVWAEPDMGRMWVYALTTMRDGVGANPEGYRMIRFPLTQPDKEEVIWESGLLSGDNIQLDRAGTTASGLIPWPNAGTFDFKSGQFIRYRNGCWPSLAPDDSGVMWVFDGTHENLRLFLPGVEGNWRVPLGDLEVLKGKAAYHPRWSNHPRIFTFTGPHPVKVNQGSGRVSVMLARFNSSLTKIEDSLSLRNSSGEPDCFPDVWVEGGGTVSLERGKIGPRRVQELAALPRPAVAAWSARAEGLCFVWERATANNDIPGGKRSSSITPQRYARYGCRFDMLTEGGSFVVDEISAAAVRAALDGGAWSIEMAVTPLTTVAARPRVIFRAGPGLELQQSGADFIIHCSGRDWLLGAGISAGQTTHLALGPPLHPGEPPVAWMNGQAQELRIFEAAPGTALVESEGMEVQFGSRQDGSADWAGRLETIAINALPADPAIVAAHAAWWKEKLAGLTPPARTIVRARLKEASPRATPDSIGAYTRSWTSALYEKTALLSGPDPGATFGVAHWTLLDRQLLTGPPTALGDERELVLESMADHPEMDSEHGSEEILPDDLTLFLDVGAPGPAAE